VRPVHDLRCPNCGTSVLPISVRDGRTVIEIDSPEGTPVFAHSARVRCNSCGFNLAFYSVVVSGVAPMNVSV